MEKNRPDRSGLKSFGLRILGVLLGLSMVYWLVDLDKLWGHVSQISVSLLLLALLLNLGRMALNAWRWRLVNTQVGSHSYGQYFYFILVSAPAKLFVPGTLGFDLARGGLLGQSAQENKGEHLISVLADRVIGLTSVLLLGLLSALLAGHFPSRGKYIAFLSLLLLAFIAGLLVSSLPPLLRLFQALFSKMGGLGQKLQTLLDLWNQILRFYRDHFSRIIGALVLSFAIHFSWFLIVYLLALNLKLELSFFVIVTVTSISWVILALPVSWMGLGVNELSFIFLLSFQGIAAEPATALSLHQAAINILFSILCIPLWLGFQRRVT